MPMAFSFHLNGEGNNKIERVYKIIGATASHPFFTSKLNSGELKISFLAEVWYPNRFKIKL